MKAPYLIFAFDVDPTAPGATQIIKDIQDDFPFKANEIPLPLGGVQNLWVLDVPASQAVSRLNLLSNYLAKKDQFHQGKVRYVVQLCRSLEASIG